MFQHITVCLDMRGCPNRCRHCWIGHAPNARLPKEALRLEKYTYTDPDTSQEREATRLGVYVLVSGRTEFKEVEVVTEGSDYYVVQPTDADSSALRAGDEVIVKGVGLYDGQLLEY